MNPRSAYLDRTEKLYETEGNLFEFEAVVISCEREGDIFLTELDRTAFFPEGGGQSADGGEIDGAAVSFVEIIEGRILHHTEREFAMGDRVRGRIDADTRRRRMQNHSAEHIVSGLIHRLFSIENAGFHMSGNEFTVDTSAPLSAEMVERVETLANRAVWENKRIICRYPTDDELAVAEYRSKTELEGRIRLVEIEDYDICACCAPHLDRTGEIGLIIIKSFIKYKKGVRLTVAAGEDAFEYIREIKRNACEIGRTYSVQPEDTYAAVCRREEQIEKKLLAARALREKLLELRLGEIEPTDKNICLFEEDCDSGMLKKLANDGTANRILP